MNDPKRILIVFLGAIFVALGFWGIKGHMDSDGYKNQVNYTTAVQASDADHFNYTVDSQQGRVLSNGTFTITPKDSVKFGEMNKSFGFVRRTEEHYTMHTREVCTSSGKTTQCHTEIYYTWDEVNEEVKESPTIHYFGRSYPIGLFNTGGFINGTNCLDFMKAGDDGGFFGKKKGCIDSDNYIDDNNRYVYDTMPLTFSGTFLATTYGGLKPFNEKSITIQQKSVSKVLHDVGRYQLIGFWVLTVLLIFLFIGACFAAYSWVFADGVWSLDE